MPLYFHLAPSLSFLLSTLVSQLKIVAITTIKQIELSMSGLSNIWNIVMKLKKTSAKNLNTTDIVFGNILQFNFEATAMIKYVVNGIEKMLKQSIELDEK